MNAPDSDQLEKRKASVRAWFERLRDEICAALQTLEDDLPARFATVRGGPVRAHALGP